MYTIAKSEYNPMDAVGKPKSLLRKLEELNKVEQPMIDQTPFTQYITFFYWAVSVSSSGAYGDVAAVAPSEKFFQVASMLFFRIYFAFCAAEVANIMSSTYLARTEHLSKKTIYEQWMKHMKLPTSIVVRVKRFNEYIWRKYHGLNENQILGDLPSSTRQEILEYILLDMLKTVDIFPKEEVGLLREILKDFRFLIITKNEHIFRAGETADEIFFIIDGEVQISDQASQKELAILKRNDFFGEASLFAESTITRRVNAKAKSNVSLGILNLSAIQDMWEKYPTLRDKMKKMARKTIYANKKEDINSKPELDESIQTTKIKQESSRVNQDLLSPKSQIESEFEKLRKELEDSPEEGNQSRETRNLLKPESNIDSPDSSRLLQLNNHINTMVNQDSQKIKKEEYSRIFISKPVDANDRNDNLSFAQEPGLKEKQALRSNENVTEFAKGEPIEQRIANKKNQESKIIHKSLLSFLERYFRHIRVYILSLVILFEWFYRPLELGLRFTDFNGPFVVYEVLTLLLFAANAIINFKDYRAQVNLARVSKDTTGFVAPKKDSMMEKSKNEGDDLDNEAVQEKKHLGIWTIVPDLLYIIPFQMIFTETEVTNRGTNVFLILFQFNRLFSSGTFAGLYHLNFFRRRYALANIIFIVLAFIIFNHVAACLFILFANARSDFNTTWLAKIPAPQFTYPNNIRTEFSETKFTVYVHASYWAHVTSSHVGVGDVVGINSDEKIYSIFIIIATTFGYTLLFGNLASMVDDLTPKSQKEYGNNYRKVLEYAKAAKLDIFISRIHAFFGYIWQHTKGIDENAILDELPNSLKSDIFLFRYSKAISYNKFFKDEKGAIDPRIVNSFVKKYRYGVFLKNDIILTAGQEAENIYVILEGEVEIVSYNFGFQEPPKLGPGDYFGGIFPSIIQSQDLMATQITKVAILSQTDFFQLKEAFPNWYGRIIKDEQIFKTAQKFLKNIRKRILKRKNNGGSYQGIQSLKEQNPRTSLEFDSSRIDDSFNMKGKNSFSRDIPIPTEAHAHAMENLLHSPRFPDQKPNTLRSQRNPKIDVDDSLTEINPKNKNLSLTPQKTSGGLEKFENLIELEEKNSLKKNLREIEIMRNRRKSGKTTERRENKEIAKIGDFQPHIEAQEVQTSIPVAQVGIELASLAVKSPLPKNEGNDNKNPSPRPDTAQSPKTRELYHKITTRKNNTFQAKSQANQFVHIMGLRRRLEQQLRTLKYYINPNSGWNTLYEFVHTLMIIYSLFAVPFYACFDFEFGNGLSIIEALILLEHILYLTFSARTAQMISGVLTLNKKLVWQKLHEQGILLNVIAIIPFNLIFGALNTKHPLLLIAILRLNRIVLIAKFPSQLSLFSAKYPQIGRYISIFRPAFYLALGCHLIACALCLIFRLEPVENYGMNFIDVLELESAPLGRQYTIYLSFMLSVATTTGYGELIIYNNYERILFIVCIYAGDAVLALVLGWFSSDSSIFPEKYTSMIEKTMKIDAITHKESIPSKTKKRIISCFTFLVESRNIYESSSELFSNLLPETLLKDMTFQQTSAFQDFPLIQEFRRNKALINEIMSTLKLVVYLPNDYILSKVNFQ